MHRDDNIRKLPLSPKKFLPPCKILSKPIECFKIGLVMVTNLAASLMLLNSVIVPKMATKNSDTLQKIQA